MKEPSWSWPGTTLWTLLGTMAGCVRHAPPVPASTPSSHPKARHLFRRCFAVLVVRHGAKRIRDPVTLCGKQRCVGVYIKPLANRSCVHNPLRIFVKSCGNYYPYIKVPRGAGFTRVLLYWDEVGAVVPYEYIQDPSRLGDHMVGLLREQPMAQIAPGAHL
jgi:hypothetical protein